MSVRWFNDILICPQCGRKFSGETSFACLCGFAAIAGTQLDLRPRSAGRRTMDLPLRGWGLGDLDAVNFERPSRLYAGPPPSRDSSELFSAVISRFSPGDRILDLGCGPRDQSVAARHLDLRYVGVDFDSPHADILADAHAIPFDDGVFEAVLAYAVVEHLYNPFVALAEVRRVLQPGGVFFGAVSQGEPYHDSYFHHTPLGIASAFSAAGLRLERLWPSYDTLHALATMGRYATAIRLMIELVYRVDRTLPFLAPRTFFRATRRQKEWNALCRAASIAFVATKS